MGAGRYKSGSLGNMDVDVGRMRIAQYSAFQVSSRLKAVVRARRVL